LLLTGHAGTVGKAPRASGLTEGRAMDVALAPSAELWVLPGIGVIGRFADGVRGFPGLVALACAERLRAHPVPAADLFDGLTASLPPHRIFRDLGVLRVEGLLVPADGRARVPAPDARSLAEAGVAVWTGEETRAGRPGPWVVPGALADLRHRPLPAGAWLPVEMTAARITVGPLFGGRGPQPCLACLTDRAGAHDDLGRLLAAHPDSRALAPRRLLAEERAAELAFVQQAVETLRDAPAGRIVLREAAGPTVGVAMARGRGGCPACGTPRAAIGLPADQPAILRPGGYRPLDAAALLLRLEAVVDPVCGIVRDLVPLPAAPALRALSRVTVARHAFPLARPDFAATLRNLRGRSAGKGRRPEEARVGAIAEALERYAGLARPGDATHVATLRELGPAAIAPNDWTLFSAEQTAAAAEWRATAEPAAWVADTVEPDRLLEWTEVTDLASGAPAWAPAALCWHQFRSALPGPLPGIADSNGCAAGQGRADALVQGLFELIERDAVGIWWHARARRPEVALRGTGDGWLDRVCAAFAALGYDLVAQDLTHDLGVCVIAAIGWPRGGRGPMLLGFGAHVAPDTALSRAVTEVLQVLPDRPAETVGGLPWAGLGRIPRTAPPEIGDFDFLRPLPQPDRARPGDGLPPAPPTAGAALAHLLAKLDAAGLRAYALDQSRPEVPLPVVRVIVPGLRHFRPRFAPGRLESVPARLGWAADPRGPNPCFIRQ
jgi:ribosomal protein S12 methylthiotransferase accessory factor